MPPKKGKKAADDEPKAMLGRPGNNVAIGIVGLPNVGKSSLFNALGSVSVPAENYPFCTIDPSVATVPVPDERFKWLCEHFHPKSEVQAVLSVTDIAGLVRGASEGAGLGNAFLSHIKAVDAIYHVTRAFEDADIAHVEESVDPVRDLEILRDELLQKDKQWVAGGIEKLRRLCERGGGTKEQDFEYATLQKVMAWLEEGKDVRFGDWGGHEIEVLNQHALLTAKPVVYLVNLSERDYARKKNKWLSKIAAFVAAHGGDPLIPFSVATEQALTDLPDDEARAAYCKERGVRSALPRIVKTGYHALQLIHFFTSGPDEVRAWTIRRGTLAPRAAGTIHTDFEKGFIKAEVQSFDDLHELGSESVVKAAGKLRQEGRRYVVADGDVMLFKFNAPAAPSKKGKDK
jgi:obg-like ATPase 1